jgi:bifunctional enzyme CysN/CysC
MVTGASTADLGLILVDARGGMVQQSRRHAFIASLLRVPHLLVAVNKMDLVDWSEDAFQSVVDEFSEFAAKLELTDVAFVPVSALTGDNVVNRSTRMPWFEGSPLLYHLEHVHVASDRNLIDCRLPVQWVIRPGGSDQDYRGYAGQIAGGVWRVGQEIVVLPSGARTRIRSVESHDGPLAEAFPPMSVTVRLEDELDISRGDMLSRPGNQPSVGREIDAMVCWMSDAPARDGALYVLKHTTRTVRCELVEVSHRVDVDSLHHDDSVTSLELNEIGRVFLRTNFPLAWDPYRRNRTTGSFILIDHATNDTVAAGMILGRADSPSAGATARTANVVWQPVAVKRTERIAATGMRGATLWLTGLPASGKSTLAGAVERALVEQGRAAYRLDGDNLRHGLNGDLGFDAGDRRENVRRTAHAARLLADAGVLVIVALVSPYRADRDTARAIHEQSGIPFVEIYMDTPLELCERRDPKGLYAQARRGEILGMTGIDDPYEPPAHADLVVRPGPSAAALGAVLAVVERLGLTGTA